MHYTHMHTYLLTYLLTVPGCAFEVLTGVGLQLLRRYTRLAAASVLLLLPFLLLLLLLLRLLLLLFLLFVRAAPVCFVHLRMHKMMA